MILGRSDMSELREALLLNVGENGRPLSMVVMPLNCQPFVKVPRRCPLRPRNSRALCQTAEPICARA
jgi:hypothetical protein